MSTTSATDTQVTHKLLLLALQQANSPEQEAVVYELLAGPIGVQKKYNGRLQKVFRTFGSLELSGSSFYKLRVRLQECGFTFEEHENTITLALPVDSVLQEG